MSYAHDRRRKDRYREGLELLKMGIVPPRLASQFPEATAEQCLPVWKAREQVRLFIRRGIREKRFSRFIFAKDKNGKLMYRGTYASSDGKTKFKIGLFLPQVWIGHEARRQWGDQK